MMFIAEKKTSALDRVVVEVLQTEYKLNAHAHEAWRRPQRDLQRLAKRDDVRQVRRYLSYADMRSILRLAEPVWPGFNRKSFSSFPVKQFKPMALKMASQLGIHLQARPYDGAEGLALRGFYVERGRSALKRALVFVNTSHHAGAVNTTFCHEIAHHLTSRFFETSPVPVHFFFDSDYSSHLDDPAELAADVMCCIAGYPEPLARDFFSMPWTRGLVAKADKLPDVVFHRVLKHITKRYGLDLSSRISVNQRLNYLAGMVHYAKLRWALLEEYDL